MWSACCWRKMTSFIHLVNIFWKSNWHWDSGLSVREWDKRKYWNNVSWIRFPRSRAWDKDLSAYNLLREFLRDKEKQNKTGEATKVGYGEAKVRSSKGLISAWPLRELSSMNISHETGPTWRQWKSILYTTTMQGLDAAPRESGWAVFCCLVVKSCLTLLTPHQLVAHQVPLSMGFPRKEYWSGLPSPSQGILLDQGLNLNLLHWQAVSLPLSHYGSPMCVVYQTC